jgi:hypothetical protein
MGLKDGYGRHNVMGMLYGTEGWLRKAQRDGNGIMSQMGPVWVCTNVTEGRAK